MPIHRRSVLSIALLTAVIVGGCTRPEDQAATSGSTIAPVESVDSTTAPSSTSPATTTVAPTTVATTAPPTTSAPTTTPATTVPATTVAPTTTPPTTAAPDELTLAADGILPLQFGNTAESVVAALTAAFGSPTSDRSTEYPTAEEGLFVTADGDEAFIAPFGRSVCWAGDLCADFGAGAPESLIFTGWAVGDAGTGAATADLATERGVRVGSVLADVIDAVDYDPAVACFTVGFGFTDGVEVTLISEDGPFNAVDANGDFTVLDPDPAQVTVRGLASGERPFSPFADC